MGPKVIVLAAGQGTRMKSPHPKVLFEIAGRPMLSWILDAAATLAPAETVVVVGHHAERVTAVLPDGIRAVEQAAPLGSGDATRVALDAMEGDPGDPVMVLPGDTPLVTGATLGRLLAAFADHEAALLTTHLDDPAGYGRVVRGGDGAVRAIVEDGDADALQRAITEVNAAMYVFRRGALTDALARIGDHNSQGELYLTDVIGVLTGDGARVAAEVVPAGEVAGVNSLDQLAGAAAAMRGRINREWMAAGVWMLDPERVYVDAAVELEPGARIYPGVHLEGATAVAAGAEIGPDCHVRDSRVAEDAVIRYSVLEGAVVGPRAQVGPFARLRPGTVLGAQAKAGTFVELKKTSVGDRSKVPHLAYMGDATLGEDVNVGAGTITCNYDGYSKHETIVGDRVFIGSDTMLVAPVELGDDSWTGAGSTITRDVPPGALAVERSSQREVPDYAARRKRRERGEGERGS